MPETPTDPAGALERGFRSGFVALVGLPNVGKSTLLNRFLGGKLSIVSAKPQTTRHSVLGIVNADKAQAVFLDTPGWLDPKYGLQRTMLAHARRAIAEDADVVCLLVEPGSAIPSEAEPLLSTLARATVPLVLTVNKIDASPPEAAAAAESAFRGRLSCAAVHKISAAGGQGVQPLLRNLLALLPEQPPFYPTDQATDRWERFYATEAVREAIFEKYSEELPYACAVELEQFIEKPGKPDLVRATIYCERETQRGILIGKGGKALRALTLRAEEGIRQITGRPLRLELWIKVLKDWRNDPNALKRFGY